MSRWVPADSGAARKITAEEIADAWLDYGSARYDDGRGDEREGY